MIGAGTCSWWTRAPDEPPDLVSLSSQQSRTVVPAEVGTELWAVLRVTVDDEEPEDRPPVQVGVVIDTSASMQGDAIEAARAAASELVRSLQDGDRLTVVTFDSAATVVVPSVELDDDAREEALEKLAEIEARGTTDLAAGMLRALDDMMPHVAAGRVSRLVLLSDGVPNDDLHISTAIGYASNQAITVTALGFGLDYDETLLAAIAQQTGGTFHFLESPDELVPIFREQTMRLQGIAAQDIALDLITGPKVDIMEVVGHDFGMPQSELSMSLGDLSRGEERVLVVRLSVGPHRAGATVELLDGRMRYVDAKTGQAVERAVFLQALADDDQTALAEAIDPEVDREIERAKAAALTLQAVALVRDGNDVDAVQMLQMAAPSARVAAERMNDVKLAEQAIEMTELANALEDEEPDASEEEPEGIEGGQLFGGGGVAGKARASKNTPRSKRALRQAHSNAMSNFQARSNAAQR